MQLPSIGIKRTNENEEWWMTKTNARPIDKVDADRFDIWIRLGSAGGLTILESVA